MQAANPPVSNTPRSGSRRLWAIFFNIHIVLSLVILAGSFLYSGVLSTIPSDTMVRICCVTLLLVYIWSVWTWTKLTGSLFNPYVLFLSSAYIFNGGQTFLEIFGLNEQGIQDGYFSDYILTETIFLIIISFLGIHAGGLLSHLVARRQELGSHVVQAGYSTSRAQVTRLVGWGLIAVSIVPAYLSVKDTLILSITSGYMAIFLQETAMGYAATSSILADLIIPGLLFVLAGSKGMKFNARLISVMVVAYCIALFLAGNRGTATMLLIAYAWVFHRCIRPVSRWILLTGGAVILFIIIPLISILRNDRSGDRLSLGGIIETFATIENPLVAPISEMGASINTVAYTVSLIPGARDFEMGVGYLYGLLGIFPNLFWDAHPSYTHGTGALWLLQTVAPASSLQGNWGFGYSFIAEGYYNFGFVGAPFIMVIFGLFIGWFVLWAERSMDPARIAAVGAFTSFVLIFARSEFLTSFGRPLVWFSLIPYAGVAIWMILSQNRIREKVGTSQASEAPPASKTQTPSRPPSVRP